MKKIVVVGGGASGLMAAVFASEGGRVILLERNEKVGKKLYITGKGRCNVTNTAEKEDFFKNIVTNGRFLYSAVNFFSPSNCYDFFEENGLKLKIERGGRVFPQSDKASDVTNTLLKILHKNSVDIKLNCDVVSFETVGNRIVAVITKNEGFECDGVILAAGGCTYTMTGSNGDGYALAKSVGHSINTPFPSLVGLKANVKEYGLTLKNINASLYLNSKRVASEFGELLFTHSGISGPTVLTLSAYLPKLTREAGCGDFFSENSVEISIDFKPALGIDELDARILKDFNENINKNFGNSLSQLLPKSIIPDIIHQSGISEHQRVNSITAAQRKGLIKLLKDYRIKVHGTDGFESAVITSGGIPVNEISPSTMLSKIVDNLYFCGEIIDVDALTGGFNLQIAFSTGALAGFSAIKNNKT